MNPYQPPSAPPPPDDRPRPAWFQRVCAIRTRVAIGSLAAALVLFAIGALTDTELLLEVAGVALAVFAIAMLGVIPLAVLGLIDGFLEGRRNRRLPR